MDEVTTMRDVKEIPQPFGPRLQVARENAGLSQAELARRVGVMVGSIKAWETNTHKPRANRLQMLAGVLDVSLPWLLEGRENAYMKGQHGGSMGA